MEDAQQSNKKSKGMLYGLIACAVLAVGGVCFGVFGMMQKAERPAEMRVEIKNEDGTTTTLETDKIEVSDDDGQMVATITDTAVQKKNPVIRGDYYVDFMSPKIGKQIRITAQNGAVTRCELYEVDTSNYGAYRITGNCAINGIMGNIFKIEFVGRGNGIDSDSSAVAFLMEDGTVKYFPLSDISDGKDSFTVKDLAVDGFVTDIIEVLIPHAGSTLFMLSDGSFVEFNETMLQ